ncbi:Uu.00g027000.m01.CDS01 [Anthostomella pinea]|uniref:Uu.00g027000.m01.CDS01 n=1 Tax=Anthostomella pinea TaxID=933095 RepID=A0AAI8YCN2_9PEZI|nr:Uu.00g027000.m01.CDS01 [Anthostomella pinea]
MPSHEASATPVTPPPSTGAGDIKDLDSPIRKWLTEQVLVASRHLNEIAGNNIPPFEQREPKLSDLLTLGHSSMELILSKLFDGLDKKIYNAVITYHESGSIHPPDTL